MWRLMVVLGLGACTGEKDDTSGNGGNGGGDSSDTTDSGGDSGVDSDSPVVTGITFVYCEPPASNPETYLAQVTVTDPQGDDTIDTMGGTWNVIQNEAQVWTGVMVCSQGICTGSARADTSGMDCAEAAELTHEFIVKDEDGNSSEALRHRGSVEPAAG